MATYTDIFQLNSRKVASSMTYVHQLCSKSKSFIMLGTECNNFAGKPHGLDMSHKVTSGGDNPTAYIYHHRTLNTWVCPQFLAQLYG